MMICPDDYLPRDDNDNSTEVISDDSNGWDDDYLPRDDNDNFNDGGGAWWLPPPWWRAEWEKGPRQRPGWDSAEPEFSQIISNNFFK